MEQEKPQDKRWKKILRLSADIALIAIFWGIFLYFRININFTLIVFFIFCGPSLIDIVKFIISYLRRGRKKPREGPRRPWISRILVFALVALTGGEISLSILMILRLIPGHIYLPVNFGLAICIGALLYRGVHERFEADYALTLSIVGRKEILRRRKQQLRKVVIPSYTGMAIILLVVSAFVNILDDVLRNAALSISVNLFAISVALGAMMGLVSLRANDIVLAHLKGALNGGSNDKGVDIPNWARELGMAKFSLRIFLKEGVKQGKFTGTFNKRKTYFSVNPEDSLLGMAPLRLEG